MTNHSTWLPFLYLRVSNVRSQRGYPPFPLFDWLWLWSRQCFDRWESRISPMWPKIGRLETLLTLQNHATLLIGVTVRKTSRTSVTQSHFYNCIIPKVPGFTIWVVSWSPIGMFYPRLQAREMYFPKWLGLCEVSYVRLFHLHGTQ